MHDGENTLTTKRPCSRRRFVEHTAERKNLRAEIQSLAARLLRRHVSSRPKDCAGVGQVGERRRLEIYCIVGQSHYFRQTEVEHLGVAPRCDQNVVGLDVPMNESDCVRRLERICYLDANVEQHRQRQCSASLDVSL